MKVAISGAGIAGLTAAYWLRHYGHEVEIIEFFSNHKERRGYMIDFFGPGYEVADKMGLLPILAKKHCKIEKLVFHNHHGYQSGYMDLLKMRDIMQKRWFSLMRGDLADAIRNSLDDAVTVRAGCHIVNVDQSENAVTIQCNNGYRANYDLLMAADGFHSGVREQVMGPLEQFQRYLGYHVAACILPAQKNMRDTVRMYSLSDRQWAIFPTTENEVGIYFLYKHDKMIGLQEQAQVLPNIFKDAKWWTPDMLFQFEHNSRETFLDSVSQIQCPNWSQGRVVLVGDAAHCLTLISGQGASVAMMGAYLLVQCLQKHQNNIPHALSEYQIKLKPYVDRKQMQAKKMMRSFVPRTTRGIFFRDKVSKYLNIPIFARPYFDKEFQVARKALPNYLLNDPL